MTSSKSRDKIWQEWRDLVNMSPGEIEDWLATPQSKSVGDTGDEHSTGRASGHRIIDIKHSRKADLDDAQWDHMARVAGFIKRHCAQGRPAADVETSKWRYSLMNWGHDPLKPDGCAMAS